MGRIILTDADPDTRSVEDRVSRDLNDATRELYRKLVHDIYVEQPAQERVMRLRDSLGVPSRWSGPSKDFFRSPVSWSGFASVKKDPQS